MGEGWIVRARCAGSSGTDQGNEDRQRKENDRARQEAGAESKGSDAIGVPDQRHGVRERWLVRGNNRRRRDFTRSRDHVEVGGQRRTGETTGAIAGSFVGRFASLGRRSRSEE